MHRGCSDGWKPPKGPGTVQKGCTGEECPWNPEAVLPPRHGRLLAPAVLGGGRRGLGKGLWGALGELQGVGNPQTWGDAVREGPLGIAIRGFRRVMLRGFGSCGLLQAASWRLEVFCLFWSVRKPVQRSDQGQNLP